MTDLYAKYTRLKFERPAERVLQIVLDTPGRLNATDARMHGELAQVWRDLDADPEVSVALIRGAGKAFSAGGDLVEAIADDFATRTRVWREARELPAAHVRRRRRGRGYPRGPARSRRG